MDPHSKASRTVRPGRFLVGFFRDYVDYCEEFTDAPAVFHQRLAYLVLSSVLNLRVKIRHGHRFFYPNLWLMLIAPSTFYRKSYALSIAKHLVEEIEPNFLIPNNFSTEGLREFLATSAQGMIVFDEFRDLMATISKRYNEDAKGFLMESYDCPPRLTLGLRAKVKGKKKFSTEDLDENGKPERFCIQNPFINIATATTMDWFRASLYAPDIPGGFLPRFFIVQAYPKTKTISWLGSDDSAKRDALVEQLRSYQQVSGEMQITPRARAYQHDWYAAFEKKRSDDNGKIAPFYSRLADEYVKKFAMLNAVERTHGLLIDSDDMAAACAYCDNCAQELGDTLADLDGGAYPQDRRRVEQFLKAQKGKVPRALVYRSTRVRARILDEILSELVTSETVVSSRAPPGKEGGPATTWYEWKD